MTCRRGGGRAQAQGVCHERCCRRQGCCPCETHRRQHGLNLLGEERELLRAKRIEISLPRAAHTTLSVAVAALEQRSPSAPSSETGAQRSSAGTGLGPSGLGPLSEQSEPMLTTSRVIMLRRALAQHTTWYAGRHAGRTWASQSPPRLFSSPVGSAREGGDPLLVEVPSVEEEITTSGAGVALKPREVRASSRPRRRPREPARDRTP